MLNQIDKTKVPQHIAIIMDGNGRWAKRQGLDRSYGHKAGIDALHNTIEAAKNAGVKYLTVYTFSTENWNRPQAEVDTLMHLMCYAIERETPGMIQNGVRLQVIGDMTRLPQDVALRMQKCVDDTSKGEAITVILALSYSARWEITHMAQMLAKKALAGDIRPEEITEEIVSQHLTTVGTPDPDLLIRTGGEQRISNYLLWQVAYAEFYFTDAYWPDFGADELYKAILAYQNRERRFGKTSEQVQEEA